MTWIETLSFANATGKLRQLYERVVGPDGNVDNILAAHSLRPHTLEGHMALYKHVLHHHANTVPKWFLEVIGVQVSLLNACAYCVEHHFAGLARLIGDEKRARALRAELERGGPGADGESLFDERQRAALDYSARLTREPAAVAESQVEQLRAVGWSDGEVLEINQVTAYFAYANRTVLGLGVSTDGDVLGLSPGNSEDPRDWNHG